MAYIYVGIKFVKTSKSNSKSIFEVQSINKHTVHKLATTKIIVAVRWVSVAKVTLYQVFLLVLVKRGKMEKSLNLNLDVSNLL